MKLEEIAKMDVPRTKLGCVLEGLDLSEKILSISIPDNDLSRKLKSLSLINKTDGLRMSA